MKFKNKYYLMRHGESELNLNPSASFNSNDSITKFPLTNKGREQVLQNFNNSDLYSKDFIVVCSDYLRAVETAKIISKDFIESNLLRERQSYILDDNDDLKEGFELKDYSNLLLAEEGVDNVIKRVELLLHNLEKEYSDKTILLISHQDTADVIQLFFNKSPLILNFSEIIELNKIF